MIRVLSVLLLTAPIAVAQELPFSPEATEACLAKAILPSEEEACIGISANLCIDTPDGYTTVGMGFCLGYERDYWDERLNAAYGHLMEIEKAVDDEMTKLGSSVPSSAEALRNMQRAWIAFRDAACAYERVQWGGGSGGGPAVANCHMVMTGQQALRLEYRVEEKRAR